jgi:hypothetical protein
MTDAPEEFRFVPFPLPRGATQMNLVLFTLGMAEGDMFARDAGDLDAAPCDQIRYSIDARELCNKLGLDDGYRGNRNRALRHGLEAVKPWFENLDRVFSYSWDKSTRQIEIVVKTKKPKLTLSAEDDQALRYCVDIANAASPPEQQITFEEVKDLLDQIRGTS